MTDKTRPAVNHLTVGHGTTGPVTAVLAAVHAVGVAAAEYHTEVRYIFILCNRV